MDRTILKNATIVNEGHVYTGDILLEDRFIQKLDSHIIANGAKVIDVQGKYVIPGVIDDQVHFREPGLTHKGNIGTESRAAVAGGITSFMEQPNTDPQTTTIAALEGKIEIAAK